MMWLSLLLAWTCSAQDNYGTWRDHTSAKFMSEEDSLTPGGKVTLGFDVHLNKGWHTYWINPGDSGTPVKLTLSAGTGQHPLEILSGPIQFPIPERLETGPIISYVYDDEVMFLADVVLPESIPQSGELQLHLEAEWLVCAEVCIPAFDSFDLRLPVRPAGQVNPSPQAEQFAIWRGHMPRLENAKVTDSRNSNQADLNFPILPDFAHYHWVDFFPLRGSQLAHTKAILIPGSAKQIHLQTATQEVGTRRPELLGLLVLEGPDHKKVGLQWGDPNYGFLNPQSKEIKPVTAPEASWLWMVISAFLGGLILNLMPCVFPILSIKLFAIVKQAGAHRSEVRNANLAYVVGVIASFLFIGGGLALLRAGGNSIGWGFQLQSPIFVLLLIWLFFLLALQMFGYFEWGIGTNWGGTLARKQGLTGSFFTGVLAVVVASPCTAPFMGAALGFALSQSVAILMAVFFAMGLGLSFPYLLFAAVPSFATWLPKPGAWMQRLKEFFAFPMLLTCVWLIWLLTELRGNVAMGLALTGMIGWVFVLWLGTKHKILAWLVALAILIAGLQTLSHLSQPPHAAVAEDADWQPYSESALQRASDETIFIDFTAEWCLTCKVNERLVLSRPDIRQFLKDHHVRLIKGDWTNQNPDITKFLNNYRRIGVPFYIAFGPGAKDGRILPEVLTPDIFKQEMQLVVTSQGGTL